jgi:hypothetical protein
MSVPIIPYLDSRSSSTETVQAISCCQNDLMARGSQVRKQVLQTASSRLQPRTACSLATFRALPSCTANRARLYGGYGARGAAAHRIAIAGHGNTSSLACTKLQPARRPIRPVHLKATTGPSLDCARLGITGTAGGQRHWQVAVHMPRCWFSSEGEAACDSAELLSAAGSGDVSAVTAVLASGAVLVTLGAGCAAILPRVVIYCMESRCGYMTVI